MEHRDRLGRFGVERLWAARGRCIEVADPDVRTGDLVRDLMEDLTGLGARRYGRRRGARNRALRAVAVAGRGDRVEATV